MSTVDYTKEKDQSVGSHHEPIYDGEIVGTPNQALVRQLKGMLYQDNPPPPPDSLFIIHSEAHCHDFNWRCHWYRYV